ncbi:MAG: LysE family transporter [bacterium]
MNNTMWHLALQNIVLGITIAAPIGPASMAVIRSGLRGGFLSGFKTALGVIAADTTYLLIVFFGLSYFISIPLVKVGLWIFGSLVLFYFGYHGIKDFFKKIKIKKNEREKDTNLFILGYSINISNPMAVIWWSAIFGSILASSSYTTSKIEGLFLSLTIVIGILMWHTFLSFLTHWGNRFVKENNFRYVAGLSGIILIWYGVTFAYKVITFLMK